MKCDDQYFGNKNTWGKECDCAGCWPRRTHNCPGCEECDGPITNCDGPDPEEDY